MGIRKWCAGLLVALSVVTGAPVILTAAAVDDDSFFVPPSPLPAGRPGDVIRARPSRSGPLLDPANAWQIMYRSTNGLGQPDAVVATVLVPRTVDPASAPIVGFAAGTQGPAFKCRPSNMLASYSFYEQPAVNEMLSSGYAVVVPDYEGYQPTAHTTYMVGRSMGPALLDAIRAAQRLPDTRLSTSAKVLVRGYSQGGGAAMWAGQLQPTYAPELNLIGVVAGGVPGDLTQVALPLEGGVGFGLLLYALVGLDNAYPELNLDASLNPAGRAERDFIQRDACTLDLLLRYRNKHLSDYLSSSPLVTPPWLARVGENKLGDTAIRVPVYQYHGTQDDLVAFRQASDLRTQYCSLGVQLSWKTFVSDHITLVYNGNPDTLAFLKDRVAGRPASSNC
jgi:pimeloyl-ACP methyl ester carboxylesterase